ncbi:hypothetical protein BAE44_0001072, partial [Dichanthelium oligosanthes]
LLPGHERPLQPGRHMCGP